MDDEDEAPVPFGTFRPSERRAMIGCAFAAGCILLMPQELIGAGIAFALAGALAVWHLVRLRQERDRQAKALPQAGAPEPEAR